MSTNKTQNYNLHSWVPEDDFIRSEFNDNFTGIDTALKSLSDGIAAEATDRAAAVNAEKTAREQAIAAEATARTAAVNAEKTAREQAVAGEANARAAAINALSIGKAELVVGFYTGDGIAPRIIELGFQPKAVLLMRSDGQVYNYNAAYGGLFFPGHPLVHRSNSSYALAETTETGFQINVQGDYYCLNSNGHNYYYLAFK